MAGEDSKRRLFIAIKEFKNDEVSKLLDADPSLLDATYRGRSAAEVAIAAKNFEALHFMREVLVLTQSGMSTSDESTRPSPSRFLRVASNAGEWTEAEKTWLRDNPKAEEYEFILRISLKIAAEQAMLKIVGNDPSPPSTPKGQSNPSPSRMFAVVSGLSAWTDEEKAWLKEHPAWLKHEEDLRATLRKIEGKPPNETPEEQRKRLLRNRQSDPPSPN